MKRGWSGRENVAWENMGTNPENGDEDSNDVRPHPLNFNEFRRFSPEIQRKLAWRKGTHNEVSGIQEEHLALALSGSLQAGIISCWWKVNSHWLSASRAMRRGRCRFAEPRSRLAGRAVLSGKAEYRDANQRGGAKWDRDEAAQPVVDAAQDGNRGLPVSLGVIE